MRQTLATTVLAFLPVAALGAETGLKRLETGDATRGWEAVGRIDISDDSFCSGALIAPSLVLTAAHCLYDMNSGVMHETEDFTFLAGWRNGRAAAYRKVRRVLAHPDYVYEGRERVDRVAYDLAFLELDTPIRLPSIQPFSIGNDPRGGDTVGIVSYGFDRSEAPSLEDDCEVLGRQPGILVLTCSVEFGSSGAPVFSMQGGEPVIVSVVSAKAEVDGQRVALGTAMTQPLNELRAAFAADDGTFRKVMPSVGFGSADNQGTGGAKFVKP